MKTNENSAQLKKEPYSCDQCNMSFLEESTLKRHYLLHLGLVEKKQNKDYKVIVRTAELARDRKLKVKPDYNSWLA